MKVKVKVKHFIIGIAIIAISFVLLGYLSSVVGWYGYDKAKYRRSTFGDKKEAIWRKVYVKDLQYQTSIDINNHFNIYIERGFRYGRDGDNATRNINAGSKYPFQISYRFLDTINDFSFYILNKRKYDSIEKTTIYLKKPYLTDTLIIGIHKLKNDQWDSVGYIKVWDKRFHLSQ